MTDFPVEQDQATQSEPATQATQGFNVESQATGESCHAVVFSTNGDEKFEFELEGASNEIFLGRSPDCEIQAKDMHVSKKHLRIYRDEQLCYFIEQLSPAGTFINTQYMKKGERRVLNHGDAITITSQLSSNTVPFASFFFRMTGQTEVTASREVANLAKVRVDTSDWDLRHLVTDGWVRRQWDISQKLGGGAFSTVKLGVRTKKGSKEQLMPGLRCAMKIIDKRKLTKFQRKRSSGESLNQEPELISSLQHPNIVSCLEWFQTETCIYLALELIQGGDLLHDLMSGGCLTEMQALRIFRQICSAVEYLHVTMKLVHRDLKPDNILLTSRDRDTMTPKLADFGFARLNMKSMDCHTYCGSPHYFAPEVIRAAQDPSCGYGKPVDMWSLGVNLYIMLCGMQPFEDEDLDMQILHGCWQFDVPKFHEVSEQAKDLIRRLLAVNPSERINIQETLKEPWLCTDGLATLVTLVCSTKVDGVQRGEHPAEPGHKKRKVEFDPAS
ncbi:fhkC [Symbiodinium microadriaticum]|nr:fhkC [Symbiodinium microadriaticum]